MKAYETKQYTNLFKEYGFEEDEIKKRLEHGFYTIFYDPIEKFYFDTEDNMGYVLDTGNHDVRTEGMSYAMMVCVQMDRKDLFNKLWKWAKTYMWMDSGVNRGFFAWSVSPEGKKLSGGPAPDGEEFFAMALFFAAHRWGEGEGIFQYSKEAKNILQECIHKGENGIGRAMWDSENKLIRFICEVDFSDPSYHLPHFYELFALWSNIEDRVFWKEAAIASREYLKKACHKTTGLAAEYANYDGTPYSGTNGCFEGHDKFYSDSYRVAANLGLDYEWFGIDEFEVECANRIQTFFSVIGKDKEDTVYEIDGKSTETKVLHPIGLLATNAQASLAANGKYKKEWVERLWNTPMRKGDRRYYDNFLYIFAFLALSGQYQIY